MFLNNLLVQNGDLPDIFADFFDGNGFVFVWSEWNGHQQDRHLWSQRNMFGARIKIVWEEQLVDPPIDFISLIFSFRQHTTKCRTLWLPNNNNDLNLDVSLFWVSGIWIPTVYQIGILRLFWETDYYWLTFLSFSLSNCPIYIAQIR